MSADRKESERTPCTLTVPEDDDFETWLRQAVRVPAPIGVHAPKVGQVVGGKYRIEEVLGQGGMGVVYRATHTVSEKAVALKWMLRPASDQRALQRFMREARAAGRIEHPNVVDVYDIGNEGDAVYLVMELLRGESMRRRLERERMQPREAIELLLPAMRGVAAAHRVGVIHRDLKPDNIFLCRSRDAEPRPAKVLDFGISAIVSTEPKPLTTLTLEGTVLGTPSYMAPEQIEASAQVDERTDVYAFGVILYESMTGRVPFTGSSFVSLAYAITNSEPVSPRELCADVSVELARVVLQALHKDPKQRPLSVEALIALLAPHTDTVSDAALKSARLTSNAHASGWIVLVAAIVALILTGLRYQRAESATKLPVQVMKQSALPATDTLVVPDQPAQSAPPAPTPRDPETRSLEPRAKPRSVIRSPRPERTELPAVRSTTADPGPAAHRNRVGVIRADDL